MDRQFVDITPHNLNITAEADQEAGLSIQVRVTMCCKSPPSHRPMTHSEATICSTLAGGSNTLIGTATDTVFRTS